MITFNVDFNVNFTVDFNVDFNVNFNDGFNVDFNVNYRFNFNVDFCGQLYFSCWPKHMFHSNIFGSFFRISTKVYLQISCECLGSI